MDKDTLVTIALKFDTTPAEIARVNKKIGTSLIHPGEVGRGLTEIFLFHYIHIYVRTYIHTCSYTYLLPFLPHSHYPALLCSSFQSTSHLPLSDSNLFLLAVVHT